MDKIYLNLNKGKNSEIINYDITKFTYKSEPEVISNYYIDKIQIEIQTFKSVQTSVCD